ncbi:MAG: hypothetical protein HKM06_01675 [Spirochaetales bacterium]|nr:hypothetical protein [Spirochaetales bacterium]
MKIFKAAFLVLANFIFASLLILTGCKSPTSSSSPSSSLSAPAAVSALTAAAAGPSSITLNWSDADQSVASYDIFWATSNAQPSTAQGNVPAGTTTYVATGLTPGSTYYFWVVAKNSGGGAAPVSTSLYFDIPAAPTGLTAAPASTTSIQLSWSYTSGQSPATGFNVYYATSSTQPATPNAQVTLAATLQTGSAYAYTITGLTNGTKYYVWLSAYNIVGSTTALTSSSTPGPVPAAVVLSVQSGATSIVLNWTDTANSGLVPAVSNYLVYWSTTSTIPTTANATVAAGTTTYTPTGLTTYTSYYFWVKAQNSIGNSVATAQTGVIGSLPATPSSFTATADATKDNTINVTWAAPTDTVSQYLLYYGVHPTAFSSATASSLNPVAATATSASIAGLNPGTSYDIYLVSKNAVGPCGTPASASATTGAPPALVTGLTAVPGNAQLALSWTASTGATDYLVYYALHQSSPPSVAPSTATKIDTSSTTASYTITGLTNYSAYDIWVEAVNAYGNVGQTLLANQTVGNLPSPVTALSAATSGSGIPITVSWTAPSDGSATGYAVYFNTTNTKPGTAASLITSATTTSYTVKNVFEGTTYYFWVDSTNPVGSSTDATTSAAAFSAAGATSYNGWYSLNPPPNGAAVISVVTGTVALTNLTIYEGNSTSTAAYTAVNSSPTTGTTASSTNSATFGAFGMYPYYWAVATDAAGDTLTYNFAFTQVPMTGTLSFTAVGNYGMTVNWSAVTGATGYNVYIGTTSTKPAAPTANVSSATTSYTDSNLLPGTTYYVWVGATGGGSVVNGALASSGGIEGTDITGSQLTTGTPLVNLSTNVAVDTCLPAASSTVPATNLTDGNTGTLAGWDNGAFTLDSTNTYVATVNGTAATELDWVMNLGAAHTISEVVLVWDASAHTYTIDGSNDNATWTTLATETGTSGPGQTTTYTGLTGSYQYIRIHVSNMNATNFDNTAWGCKIKEATVYGN